MQSYGELCAETFEKHLISARAISQNRAILKTSYFFNLGAGLTRKLEEKLTQLITIRRDLFL